MYRIILLYFCLASVAVGSAFGQHGNIINNSICLNSIGFLPAFDKKATVTHPCSTFFIKRSTDSRVVFSARANGALVQKDVGQQVWILDFSGLRQPATYYIDIPGVGRSIDFHVGSKIYESVFPVVTRAFYLWRYGTAVKSRHNNQIFAHASCHLKDARLDIPGYKGEHKDGTGRWHDAGDYGKYLSMPDLP